MGFVDALFGLPRDLIGKADSVEFRILPHGFALAGLIAVCAVVIVLAIYLYRRSRGVVGRRAYWLNGLRALQVLLLLLVLLAPSLSIEGHTKYRGRTLVLIDDTASMAERDLAIDPAQAKQNALALGLIEKPDQELSERDAAALKEMTRRDLIARTLTRDRSSFLRKLDGLREIVLSTAATDLKPLDGDVEKGWPKLESAAVGEATFLGTALHEAVDRYRGTLSEVILLSDGVNNGGLDPLLAAKEAKEASVRVFSVGVGSPAGLPDSILLTAVANRVVNKDDDVEVVVDVRSRGYDGKSTTVQLRRGAESLDEKPLTLRSDLHQRVSLGFKAGQLGVLGLTAVVVPQKDEKLTANNYYQLAVRVVDEKYRAIYIDGYPRWEYRFLKNLISRDRGLNVQIILQSEWQAGTPTGVPDDAEALKDVDVLLIGDADPGFFTPKQIDLVKDFVSERGGGLILLAGEDHMPTGYRGTSLEKLLPVVLPEAGEPTFHIAPPAEPFHLLLTPEGDGYPAMRLEDDPVANQETWSHLPGHWWCRTANRLRPGATALALHSGLKNSYGPMPLIAMQRFGKGQVMYLAIDSTWRWRYTWGEAYFDRFWGQMIRNLAPERKDKRRLSELAVGRDVYREGEAVPITALAYNEDGAPLEQATLLLSAEEAGGEPSPVVLKRGSGRRPGEFTGEWTPRAGGYLLRLEGNGITPAAARIRVGPARAELEDTVLNEALLRQMADLSGGRYVELSALPSIVNELPKDEREVSVRTHSSLWDVWPLFALLVGANLAELILRKRWGLL